MRPASRGTSRGGAPGGVPSSIPRAPSSSIPRGAPSTIPRGSFSNIPRISPSSTPKGPPSTSLHRGSASSIPRGPPSGTPKGPPSGAHRGPPSGTLRSTLVRRSYDGGPPISTGSPAAALDGEPATAAGATAYAARAAAGSAGGAGFACVCCPLRMLRNPAAARRGPAAAVIYPDGHDRSILCIDIHLSKRLCATGSADGSLRLFDLSAAAAAAVGVGVAAGVAAAAPAASACAPLATLYGPKWGHNDWVTSCAFAADGCLLSGGMDGLICLWDTVSFSSVSFSSGSSSAVSFPSVSSSTFSSSPSPSSYPEYDTIWDTHADQQQQQQEELQQQQQQRRIKGTPKAVCRRDKKTPRAVELPPGHRAGVSEVQVGGPLGAPIGASVGYDGSLRLWGLRKKQQLAELPAVDVAAAGALSLLSPLLQFVWYNSFAAAGSKKGFLTVWDINQQKIAARAAAAHRGAVGDLQLLLPAADTAAPGDCSSSSSSSSGAVPLLLSGGRGDGRLRVFDLRCLPAAAYTAHAHAAAINRVLPLRRGGGGPLGYTQVATLAADGYCKLWDLRQQQNPVAALHAANSPLLCGAVLDEQKCLLCAGTAEGAVCLLDMGTANDGAPRAITMTEGGPQASAATPPETAVAVAGGRGDPGAPRACWGYGCDSKGAVHTLQVVEIPNNKTSSSICAAVVAGGDDGRLACLRLP